MTAATAVNATAKCAVCKTALDVPDAFTITIQNNGEAVSDHACDDHVILLTVALAREAGLRKPVTSDA